MINRQPVIIVFQPLFSFKLDYIEKLCHNSYGSRQDDINLFEKRKTLLCI